jgi:hypothetical protein
MEAQGELENAKPECAELRAPMVAAKTDTEIEQDTAWKKIQGMLDAKDMEVEASSRFPKASHKFKNNIRSHLREQI